MALTTQGEGRGKLNTRLSILLRTRIQRIRKEHLFFQSRISSPAVMLKKTRHQMSRYLHGMLVNTKSTTAGSSAVPGNDSVIANSCYTVPLFGVIHCFQQKRWFCNCHRLVTAPSPETGRGVSSTWIEKGRDVVFSTEAQGAVLEHG